MVFIFKDVKLPMCFALHWKKRHQGNELNFIGSIFARDLILRARKFTKFSWFGFANQHSKNFSRGLNFVNLKRAYLQFCLKFRFRKFWVDLLLRVRISLGENGKSSLKEYNRSALHQKWNIKWSLCLWGNVALRSNKYDESAWKWNFVLVSYHVL